MWAHNFPRHNFVFYKIFWNRYLVDFLLHKWHFSKSGAREREWEGRPPRCSTSWKKGHHLVKSGPILAILGSKWPQRVDLSFGTMFSNAKMAINGSKRPRKMIRWSRKRKVDQKRSFQSKITVICSHFYIKNTVSNDRSILCGHLEPKMVKIGPKLTEWWPFFQDMLHLGGRPSRSRFPGV